MCSNESSHASCTKLSVPEYFGYHDLHVIFMHRFNTLGDHPFYPTGISSSSSGADLVVPVDLILKLCDSPHVSHAQQNSYRG